MNDEHSLVFQHTEAFCKDAGPILLLVPSVFRRTEWRIKVDEIDAQLKELGLEQTRLVGIGAFRELDKLMRIYNSFEHKYTRDEIEAAQADYWNKRLNRQATLEAIGGSQAQAAHLDSLRQIGALEILPEGGIRTVSQEMQQLTEQKELA